MLHGSCKYVIAKIDKRKQENVDSLVKGRERCSGERKTILQLEEALSKSVSKQVVFVFLRL